MKTMETIVSLRGVSKIYGEGETAVTALDWRIGDTAWPAVKVPRAIERGVRSLMRSLSLCMGALDFVVDADERWWFLELNPAGEWGWLERDLGLPIADAIS
jgi:hypothetical protein